MILDPSTWPADEVTHYLELGIEGRSLTAASGKSDTAMVVGGTGPFAQYAGRRALELGGNAVDAALVTACAQITLAAGCWISFAGIAGMVIHDAATGEVTVIDGPFRTFAGETDPMTIPPNPTPSGRTAMVGGYFAAIKEAHDRFGRLPWSEILAPSIWLAREGFPPSSLHVKTLAMRREVLRRTPEGREIFYPGGEEMIREGGVLRQPQLADTLEKLANEGIDHLYTGEWAERFVEQVNRDGGRAAMEDLAAYQPQVGPGLRGSAYGLEIVGPHAPHTGGASLIEGLQLCETLGVGDPTTDPEALRWLSSITRQNHNLRPVDPERRLAPDHVEAVAAAMREADGPVGPSRFVAGSHSDYVATADAEGNVVAMCHSINCVMWGATGIFVDGISIPDAANFQQAALAEAGPGELLGYPMNPALGLRDGEVVLASSSIGAGLLETTLTHVHGVLGLGLSVADAVARPRIHFLDLLSGDSVTSSVEAKDGKTLAAIDSMLERSRELTEQLEAEGGDLMDVTARMFASVPNVIEDGFDPEVVAAAQAAGAKLKAVPIDDETIPRGFWVGITRNPETGALEGARTPWSNGLVEAL